MHAQVRPHSCTRGSSRTHAMGPDDRSGVSRVGTPVAIRGSRPTGGCHPPSTLVPRSRGASRVTGTRVGSHARLPGRSSRRTSEESRPWWQQAGDPPTISASPSPLLGGSRPPQCSVPAGSGHPRSGGKVGREGLFHRDRFAFSGCRAPPESPVYPLAGKSLGGNLHPPWMPPMGVRAGGPVGVQGPLPGLP